MRKRELVKRYFRSTSFRRLTTDSRAERVNTTSKHPAAAAGVPDQSQATTSSSAGSSKNTSLDELSEGEKKTSLEATETIHAAGALTPKDVEVLSHIENERREREFNKEREEYLNWISSTSHGERHRSVYEKRHPGTGEWFLRTSEFQQWLNSPISALLWCHGKPGAGKSVLASSIIETIIEAYGPDKEVGICFAYYDYTRSASQGSVQIILSLIKQLCLKADIPDAFKRAKQNADPASTLGDQHHFSMVARSFREVFLIIDALDECLEDEERPRILKFLGEIMRELPHVRIFVTSRREADIVREFESRGTPTIQLEAHNMAADIEKYVGSEVTKLRSGFNGKKLYIENEKLAQRIVDTLTDRADGMFLWVNLQLQQLCKASARRKDSFVEQALEKPPSSLDDTYSRILEQIEGSDEPMRDLAFRCLMWVFYAERPLKMRELRFAVAIPTTHTDSSERLPEPEDEEAILYACANLLEKDSETFVRPVHYSVKEFFTSPSKVSGSKHVNLARDCYNHQQLATACINELKFNLQPQPCTTFQALADLFQTAPFIWYAAQHFDIHTFKVEDPSEDFLQEVRAFLSSDGQFLAAMLQSRAVKPDFRKTHEPNPWRGFISPKPVDGIAVMYSSQLYHVDKLEDYWKNKEPPRGSIHRAASACLLKAVGHLIDHGIDVDERDDVGRTALYRAAEDGHTEMVALLIARGAYANASGGNCGNALQAASAAGHEGTVQILLDAGTDVNAQGGQYGNALQAASAQGHEKIVQILLDNGADIDSQGGCYHNALQAACVERHEKVVQVLLDNGVDVNAQGGYYGNALQAASDQDHEKIVQILLDNGADVNAQGGQYGSALQAASIGGYVRIFQILLDKGADINAQGGEYGNALQAACTCNSDQEEIVQILLDKGADVNAQGGLYGNALQAASASDFSQVEIVRSLLDRGANVNAYGGKYGHALQAASAQCHEKVVQILLDNGADINAQGGKYGNALLAAASYGWDNIIRVIFNNDADLRESRQRCASLLAASDSVRAELMDKTAGTNSDIKKKDTSWYLAVQVAAYRQSRRTLTTLLSESSVSSTAKLIGEQRYCIISTEHKTLLSALLSYGRDMNKLISAAGEGNKDVLDELVRSGLSPEVQNPVGWSALHEAAISGQLQMVRSLLEKYHVNPHLRLYGGSKAIHWAADGGSIAVMDYLLQSGMPIDEKDYEGNTPLYYAAEAGRTEMVEFLLREGAHVNALPGQRLFVKDRPRQGMCFVWDDN